MGCAKYANGFRVTLHEDALGLPLSWKTPQMVFVNSMSDLFHEDVPEWFVQRVFDTMREATWHSFQILTKRSARLCDLDPKLHWPKNAWMGVTVERRDYLFRIDHLRRTGARVRFVSFEPLLGPLPELDLSGIHWVIVGGESGPRARPMREEWAVRIRDMCAEQRIPFFFKQWGGVNKKRAGRKLSGRTWDELPEQALARR